MRLLSSLAAALTLASCAPTSPEAGPTAPSPSPAADPTTLTEVTPPPGPVKPLITIRNMSNRDIMVGVRGPETQMISIPKRAKRTISLPPGNYKWAATAEKTETQVGSKSFALGQQYVWDFKLD